MFLLSSLCLLCVLFFPIFLSLIPLQAKMSLFLLILSLYIFFCYSSLTVTTASHLKFLRPNCLRVQAFRVYHARGPHLKKKNFFFLKDFIYYLLLKRGGGGEKERERNINVWEVHQLVASHMPPTRHLACNTSMCLAGNRTGDFSVHRPALNPLSHTSQSGKQFLYRHK